TDGDGNQLPYLDEITMNLTQTAEPRYTAISTGDVHVAASLPTNRVQNLNNQAGVEPEVIEGARALRLAFNHPNWDPVQPPGMVDPPEGCPIPANLGGTEDAVKFKQGVMHSINIPAINEAMMDGLAGANHSHMPSWHIVYRDAEEQGLINHYDHDPDRAMELFEESIGDPASIGTWNAHGEQEETADHTALTIMEQNWSQLGFDVNAEPLLWPEGFANWEWGGEESETRSATCPTTPPDDQHTFLYQFDILTPDPSAWLGINRWTPGFRDNRAHYLAAQDLCRDAATTIDPDERHQKFVELLGKLNNDVAHGVIFWLPRVWARRSEVRNLNVNPYLEYKFGDVWLDE
ncbi:MAG: ABC transporter substrate-binding protein, partial [Halobacteriales archaeon]|nr:ABC transporter substrate-binding protein [Halobacteriales archaeon]